MLQIMPNDTNYVQICDLILSLNENISEKSSS